MDTEKRNRLETLLQSRFFYTPSFEIYGSTKGLYDYGPIGTAVNENILALWRKWFIFEENMQQVSASSLTPEIVFKSSGHCDNFEDNMVRDEVTQECYRADHLLENAIQELLKNKNLTLEQILELQNDYARADDFSLEDLSEKLEQYNVKSPDGNSISNPFPFNLMFSTQIGATGKIKGYLRPETAQGIFVNFPRLLEYNAGKLPFAVAQIGTVYRNEISPRSSVLRVREFLQAEIEHFVDPRDKSHNKFNTIKNIMLPLYSTLAQLGDNKEIMMMTCEEAVLKGLINSETLCYFLARTYLFLLKIGVHKDKIRFRQHLSNEMAHYAIDCWDAELYTSYGWVECVGHADRSSYDLSVHAKGSGNNMTAFVLFPEPREIELLMVESDKGGFGKKYKKLLGEQYKVKIKNFVEYIDNLNPIDVTSLQKDIINNVAKFEDIEITNDLVKFKTTKKLVKGENIIPGVIEPSFGIGRIIYCLLEHAFYIRHDSPETKSEDMNKRIVLGLKPIIAPVCCVVLPLLNKNELIDQANKVEYILKRSNITTKIDSTAIAIGRRYSRNDEIGIPFAVTIDYDGLMNSTGTILSEKSQSVTIRERDSMEQIRVSVSDLPYVISCLLNDVSTWIEIKEKFSVFYF
jgi:glycyl-tRNA synthetase